MNSRGASVPKEPTRIENKVSSSLADGDNPTSYYLKKQTILSSFDAKSMTNIEKPSSHQAGLFNNTGSKLELKKTELRGKLNDLLDRFAVNNGVKSETRSVAPVFQRDAS